MFGYIMSKKENCLYFLRQILPELDIQDVKVTPQKEFNKRLKERNTRFDIWAKNKTQEFDIEMQMRNDSAIGKRFRYYQSQIDKDTLPSGKNYRHIKASYIIFFSPFDPFGLGQAKYEMEVLANRNNPESVIDTNAHWLYFNSLGHDDCLSYDLRNFLDYMNGKVNEDSDFIKKIDSEVKDYVASPEWRHLDMNLDMMLADNTYDVEVEDIKKSIQMLKSVDVSNEKILNNLKKHYGDHFSEEELKQIMKEA
ncbi:Rpn family recombination-promoting nuclease/putative transposase [Lactobacillus hamsteri]|uniref:Rpn family recombination-promoting nuclease/putative transposase n=1 Tax=Lactobacillus hamsteri TaxID=96565 RepID=UPI0022A97861|nr:Rpn family recombination-promoting nuclease/putative transposase [Lactobacillus hamsteri]